MCIRDRADIRQLKSNLELHHPGLYRYASREEIDHAFSVVETRVIAPLTVLEFFRALSPAVAAVQCGHTRLRLPDGYVASDQSARLFPLDVEFSGEAVLVRRDKSDTPVVPPGSELLSIDGVPIAEIVDQILRSLPRDGVITTGPKDDIEERLGFAIWQFIDERRTQYRVEYRSRDRHIHEALLKGISPAESRKRSTDERPGLSLKLLETPNAAVLDIRGFSANATDSQGVAFEDFLEQSFETLCEREVENLILDLRGNGGGADMLGVLLVSYLSPEPFGYFAQIEVTKAYSGHGQIVTRDNGRKFVTAHEGLQVHHPQEDYFLGNLYVLIDGGTFSTATDVATVLHHNELGVFIGEETGGGYDGNTSGTSTTEVLHHSRLRCSIPRWMYTTANIGHEFFARGVIPDHIIPWTTSDLASGSDTQLNFVLALIRTQ